MRILGIILIVLGIVMAIFNGFNFTKKEKVADIGPVEINKNENKHVGWPTYVGGVVVIAGIVLVVAGKKKD